MIRGKEESDMFLEECASVEKLNSFKQTETSWKVPAPSQVKRKTYNPVDKGWSWVILACLFGNQMLCIGFLRSFGILFVAIKDTYHPPATIVFLIGGIQGAAFSLTALVAMTLLLQYISVRNIIILGGLIAFSGLALSFFARSETLLIFTQTLLFGVGNSMCFGPGFVLLGAYFDKRRALAAAIANTGGSLGSFLMPPITRLLLQEFSFNGTCLILAGIFAHNIVFAMFYTPPASYLPPKQAHDAYEQARDVPLTENKRSASGNAQETSRRGQSAINTLQDNEIEKSQPKTPDYQSYIDHDHDHKAEGEADSFLPMLTRSRSDSCPARNGLHSSAGALTNSKPDFTYSSKAADRGSKVDFGSLALMSSLSGSNTVTLVTVEQNFNNGGESLSAAGDDDSRNTPVSGCSKLSRNFKEMFDPTLLRSPMCWLLLAYNCFGIVGVNLPSSFLPSLVVEKGMTMTEGALLLTMSGGLDVISRLVPGFIAQMKWMKPQTMVCIAYFIMGLMFQLTAFFNTFTTMAVFTAVYGLCAGTFISMLQLIIIDFVGLKHFPKAFGLAQLAFGITTAPGFPLLGFIKDISGTYVTSFHLMGSCILLSSVLLMTEPLARRLDARLEKSGAVSSPHT